MKKRIEVMIGGHTYTLIAEDDAEYVRRVAAYADRILTEQKNEITGSDLDAAVMAVLNISDEYFKLRENTDNLRVEVRDYLDELTACKAEIAELKRRLAGK